MASVQDLQKQLQKVTEERNALQQDVEKLCLAQDSRGSSMWSGSYVLSEQLKSLQSEAKELRKQLKGVQEARDEALQDASAARAAQHALDHALNTVKQEARDLAAEKEFYQASASRAVADVEASSQDLSTLRGRLADTELLLGKAEGLATTEGRLRKEAEASLAQRQQQVAQLRNELEMKKSDHSSTTRQLTVARETCHKLEASQAALQSKVMLAGEDLERTKQQLQQFRESEGRLRVQWQEAQAQAAQLQGTSKGQAEQLALLSAEVSTLRAAAAQQAEGRRTTEERLSKDLATAQEQVAELTAELRQARQDVDAAEQRLTQLQRVEHDHRAGGGAATVHAAAPARSTSGGSAAAAGAAGEEAVAEGGEEGGEGQGVGAGAGGEAEAQAAGGAAAAAAALRGAAAAQQAAGAAQDAADDAEQLVILRTMVHDLKVKLAQATQEKVQALLAMAEVKQAAAAAAAAGRGGPVTTHHGHHQSVPMGIGGTSLPSSGAGAGGLGTSPSGTGLAAFMASRLPLSWLPGGVLGGGASEPGGGGGAGRGGSTGRVQRGEAAGTGSVLESMPLLDAGRRAEPGGLGRAGRAAGGLVVSPRHAGADAGQQGDGAFGGGGSAQKERSGAGLRGGGREGLPPAGAGAGGTDTFAPIAAAAGGGGGGSGGGASGAGAGAAAASALQAGVRQLVGEAGEYLAGLQQAAHIILGTTHDPSLKWSALTGLSKLHVQLNHTRARLGLAKPASLVDGRGSNSQAQFSKVPGRDGEQDGCVQLTAQVLDLVDLGLACLEAYHRQEALSSVMAGA